MVDAMTEATRLGAISRLPVIWKAWSGPRPRIAAETLLAAGCVTLFLDAAATLHLVYTIRVPYLLLAAAVIAGAPWVVKGWRRAPEWTRWTAFALGFAYLVATLGGHELVLRGGRSGSYRDLVYLGDLALGLAVVGLVVGLGASARVRQRMIGAVSLGACLVAAYAIYQWFAQHYHLPFARLNNTLDTNGVTAGGPQGVGLLGPQTQAEQDRLAAHHRASGDQHPARRNVLPLGLGRAAVTLQRNGRELIPLRSPGLLRSTTPERRISDPCRSVGLQETK